MSHLSWNALHPSDVLLNINSAFYPYDQRGLQKSGLAVIVV